MAASPPIHRHPALLPLLLFLFGLATTALPILAPRFPATQDGGAHLNSAMVLAALETHPSPLFQRVYARRDTPPSNQLAARLMAWAAERGLGATAAAKLVWLLLFAAAAAVIVGNLLWCGAGQLAYAPLLFPAFAGVLANLGFENYLFGLVAFIQSAFCLRAGLRRPSIPWVAAMAGLAALTYLAHPFAGIALAITAAAIGAADLLRFWRPGRGRALRLVPLACILVGLVVTAFAVAEAYDQILRFITLIGAHASDPVAASAPADAIPDSELRRDHLLMLAEFGLLSYAPADLLFVAPFLLLLLWLGLRRLRIAFRTPSIDDHWLAAIAALFAVCAAVPRAFEPFLPWRILACFLVATVLWLATAPPGPRARAALLALGLVFNAAWCGYRLWWNTAIDPILAEFASAGAAIPEHTTLVEVIANGTSPLSDCLAPGRRRLPCNFQPTLHFAGQIVGRRDVAELLNYQLDHAAGFFPIDLRAPWTGLLALNLWLSNWPPEGGGAPTAETASAIERLAPDVLLTWDERRARDAGQALFPAALAPLLTSYDLAFRSEPLGLAAVYLRRGLTPAAAPPPTAATAAVAPTSAPPSPPPAAPPP